MNIAEVKQILLKNNPIARSEDIRIYSDAYFDYIDAANNISENGTIVAHPRTGAPIENPYLKIKISCISIMHKVTKIRNTEGLW